jgi:hypothetical protein
MDGLSGPNGRFELMGRRWGMKGLSTAVSLAAIGWILAQAPFPLSYQLVMIGTAAAAMIGFRFSRTFRIADQPRRPPAAGSPMERARAFAQEIGAERRFLGFLGRHAVFTFGLAMALPLIPLFYVRELGASDAWIGLIGTTQALLTMAGYFLWRGPARRKGASWVLVPSVVGAGVFPAVLAVAHHELAVAVLVGLYGISLAGIELSLFDELMKSIPPTEAVRFAALDTGASNFAGMTGPITGAVLAGAIGIPGALVAAGAVGLLGAGLFTLSVASRRRSAAATARAAASIAAAPLEAGTGATE